MVEIALTYIEGVINLILTTDMILIVGLTLVLTIITFVYKISLGR